MIVGIFSPLQTKRLPNGRRKLTSQLKFKVDGVEFVIEEGFETDYSSFPWFSRWIVRWSKVDTAGVIHDWLLKNLPPNWSRKRADQVWYVAAQIGSHSANKVQAYVSWLGIRANSLWQANYKKKFSEAKNVR